ncbi:type II secretion system protein D [bacterium MnTg02]|nr:type II secretion system protein D [bacterium MnTg02]
MSRLAGIWLALSAFVVLLAACAGPNLLEPKTPGLLERLANKDLSPPASPRSSKPRVEYASGSTRRNISQRYPGDPNVAPSQLKFSGAQKSKNGYELNFSNAELSELAKVILRDTLELPYVFDPRVSGRVTLSTGRAVPRNELLLILESVLAMNRASMIKEGKLYRIMPANEARLVGSSAVDYMTELKQVGPGYGISVFPLRYVSSQSMLKTLGSFTAKKGVLRANVHENMLIVRGTARERQALLEVAAMFDVDWMRGQSAAIFVLQNISPGEVIPELTKIFQTRQGRGKGLVRFQVIDRLNAILVLSQKADLLDRVEIWIKRLDRTGSEAGGYYVYRVEYGKAKDLAALLSQAFSGGGGFIRSAEETTVAPDRSVSEVSSNASEGSNASGAEAAASADITSTASLGSRSGGSGSAGVRIIPDVVNNKLLIKASARDYRQIINILKRIDKAPLQVLINATLAEVTLNDKLKYGVQVFLEQDGGSVGALGFTNSLSSIGIAPSVPGLNFIIGSTVSPKVILDALASETAVKVVSSPSIVVIHNKTATLQVGDEVPIATRSATSVTDPEAPVVNEIQFRDTGVILKVTPRVNSNGLVTMEIEQEISAVSSTTAIGASGSLTPTISQRRISTTIAVQSGQMVVLGGLISEQTDNEKSRVPLLRKVPYLGNIIGETSRTKTRTELIVFIQPVVIRNSKDASEVAQALRAGLQSMAPPPLPKGDLPVNGKRGGSYKR